MDKHLRPAWFDAEPNNASSEREWRHWHRTFENFLVSIAAQQPDRLNTLINYVSAEVYEYIADAADYDAAIELYIHSTNDIYNRHLLATRQQNEGETLDQFLQSLKKLAKVCQFSAVTADQYRQEYMQNSFINRLGWIRSSWL